MSKLVLAGIGKSFGPAIAVSDVSLTLVEGEFVSLLGPSGCGKTTTLRMIAGFMPPTTGTISVDDRQISSPGAVVPPEKRGMSMIFQSYAIWPNMTVRDNVAFGLTLRRLAAAEIRRRTDTMLEVVHLAHLADRYPAELSGGQQQRVALARAIVIEPQVLLLDEPLSNLDANLREEMRSEIRRLHDEFRITTVYVTHDQSEAMVTSDRIVVMNAGRIEQVADPVTLYRHPATRFVASFIGRTNLLDGVRDGDTIRFPGFSVPCAPGSVASFSVRPQSIVMSAEPAPPGAAWQLRGAVTERAYLGEHWDYLVAPEAGGPALKVSTPPLQTWSVGDRVWLHIDPTQAAPIPAPNP